MGTSVTLDPMAHSQNPSPQASSDFLARLLTLPVND